jgi:hypothetical protein
MLMQGNVLDGMADFLVKQAGIPKVSRGLVIWEPVVLGCADCITKRMELCCVEACLLGL